jgi:hypothetical protein
MPDAGPCGGECSGDTPVCDESTGTCVQCTTDDTSACTGETPLCDEEANECVACLVDSDCEDAAASECGADNTCVPCTSSDACAGRDDGLVACALSGENAGSCVECTGADSSGCGGNVCDVRQQTCTTMPPNDVGLCQECVSDEQCTDGKVCVPMTFDTPEGVTEEVGPSVSGGWMPLNPDRTEIA